MILRKSQARKSIVCSIIGLLIFWPLSVRAFVISSKSLRKIKADKLPAYDQDLFKIAYKMSLTGVILWPLLMIALSLISFLNRSIDSVYY